MISPLICICFVVLGSRHAGAWSGPTQVTRGVTSSTSTTPIQLLPTNPSSPISLSSSSSLRVRSLSVSPTSRRPLYSSTTGDDDEIHSIDQQQQQTPNHVTDLSKWISSSIAAMAILSTVTFTTGLPPSMMNVANAYVPSDYASETVTSTIKDLKSAAGSIDDTFKVYESIAGIITEGKGVGGMVNYQGIQLERGYVADEDTTVYNPGLSLLTESEKERLVEAVIDARKTGLTKGQWNENNEFAFQFLREKLDPYHMQELGGFLKVAPFYAAFLYVGVLGVQQFARGGFQVAYLVGAAAFFLPILALVAAGP